MPCKTNSSRCSGTAEGEGRKAEAFVNLNVHRAPLIRRAQRTLLTVLLQRGSATMDDVRQLVEPPSGINPTFFGAVPTPIARARIIQADGYTKTCRPLAHARKITLWLLIDRAAAERWLCDHPDLPDPADDYPPAGEQRVLFDSQETATPTAGTAGAAL